MPPKTSPADAPHLRTPADFDYLYDELLLLRPSLTRANFDTMTAVFNAHGNGIEHWRVFLDLPPLWATNLHRKMATRHAVPA